MRALGDKIGSTIIAQSAGVPTIAWNGDGLKVLRSPVPPFYYTLRLMTNQCMVEASSGAAINVKPGVSLCGGGMRYVSAGAGM